MVVRIIAQLFTIYQVLILVRILGSWVPELTQNQFMRMVARLTDPYLDIFRQFIPPLGPLDISPIVALFVLSIIRSGVIALLL